MNLPDDLEQRLRDGIVEAVAGLAEKVPGGNKTSRVIRQLSTQAPFYNAFDTAITSALSRFVAEYTPRDEDLVEAIISDGKFWESQSVRTALMTVIQRPGSWLINEREIVIQHFADVLPKRINRERVDKAVTFFLQCVVEELWTLPGVNEIRGIYNLQFQKMSAEATRQQVALLEAQLQATTQLSTDVREGLIQLATILEQRLLTAPQLQPTLPSARHYHNLPQPDYTRFVGRQKELDWLRRCLAPSDRVWQMVIAGIGGVGKSALALAIAHEYSERYNELPLEERFEAIIWISAKEEVLTIQGRKEFALPGLIFHTLEDIYTTIAQTLEREDITRAILEEQDHLVQRALSAQRTLLVIDSLESVTDDRVRTFLRNLPLPTKCIITSREWVDVAAVLKLTGLPLEEAEKMINEEATVRRVNLKAVERQQLFKRTSGLPLPIKLSIARMASGETFDQVVRWLGNATGDLPEHCVKGQIDMAHQLDPNAWRLLLVCSLFDRVAGASREALGSIADVSLAERDDGLTLLQRLFLLNLTESDRDEGLTLVQQLSLPNQAENKRFRMLPMVQGYVGAELVEAEFGESLIESWLDWLLKFTQDYGTNLNLHVEKSKKFGPEYSHLLSAIRWCHEYKRWKKLIQLAQGTWSYLYLVGLFGELLTMLQFAVEATKALQDEQCEGRFLRLLGQLFRVQGQYDKALTGYLDKAEEIARQHEDDAELGRVIYVHSNILADQNDLQEAEKLAETALEIGERLNDPELKIVAVHRLSKFDCNRQQFNKALESLERAEQWCRELDSSRELAWNMYLRGTTLIQQGNVTAAEPFLMQSLNMATDWSEHRLIAHNKQCLAQVYSDTDQLLLALQMAKEAHDLYERLGMTVHLAEVEVLLQNLIGKNTIL